MVKVLWSLGLMAALITPATQKACQTTSRPATQQELQGAQVYNMVGTVRHISENVSAESGDKVVDITVEADNGAVLVLRGCGANEPRVWENMHAIFTYAQANETDELYWPCYTITDVKKLANVIPQQITQPTTIGQPITSSGIQVPY